MLDPRRRRSMWQFVECQTQRVKSAAEWIDRTAESNPDMRWRLKEASRHYCRVVRVQQAFGECGGIFDLAQSRKDDGAGGGNPVDRVASRVQKVANQTAVRIQ